MITLNRELYAVYRNRIPDPGVCRVLEINWESERLVLSNGVCRYFPDFDQVELTDDLGIPIETSEACEAELLSEFIEWRADPSRKSDMAVVRNKICRLITEREDLKARIASLEVAGYHV